MDDARGGLWGRLLDLLLQGKDVESVR